MTQEIAIPTEVPVMTLSDAVLFPHAMMPLYIFEARYREMLREVLATDRVFAVAGIDEERLDIGGDSEPAHSIAGVGIVRACTKNEDGTSNLILQGLIRVRFDEIIAEKPFRKARISPLPSTSGDDPDALRKYPRKLLPLIETQIRLGSGVPDGVLQFLRTIEDPEAFLDIAIYSLCSSTPLKQELLETTDVPSRFTIFEKFLRSRVADLRLQRKLKGGLDDEDIGNN